MEYRMEKYIDEFDVTSPERNKHFHEIEKIIRCIGHKLEGNCVYNHLTLHIDPQKINKQINLLWSGHQIGRKLCEVGFNAGHSALIFLMSANKDIDFLIIRMTYVIRFSNI